MCGIAGIVSLGTRPVKPEVIKRMCDIQAHRGPDDAGYVLFRLGQPNSKEGLYWCNFTDPDFWHINRHLPIWGEDYWRSEVELGRFSVAMGHRRLSIIDLTPYGHQPMASSDRRYWVVYNGEIYNFPELTEELKKKGHVFRTKSDTEVLLHLWEEHGLDCLNLLNGMFAFALYDSQENILTIARDRFGVKPLYYTFTDDYFLFASEIKGILASRAINPAIHHGAMVEYFTFQNTYSSQTLFQDVHILHPGEYLTMRPGSRARDQARRYHASFPQVDLAITKTNDVPGLVAETFAKAVKRQLISDVEVGAYLSGGMDSGSIVAVTGRHISRLVTFTGGFDLTNISGIEQGFDERELAEQLSYLLQTEHYAVVLHAGDLAAALDKITWHMDDPRVGICYQNWYVAKLASRFVKVCLAGAGGDELFAGYPWRYLQGMTAGSLEELDRFYFRYWHRLLPPGDIPALVTPEVLAGVENWAWESFRGVMDQVPPPQEDLGLLDNLLQRMLHFEFKTFLHGFLVTEDHISMAHSLETRVPFLDNDLTDLAWRLSPPLKVNTELLGRKNGQTYIESTEGKRILRQAMEQYLPVEFTRQRKQGFSPPDENWYRGPSMDYIKNILFDKRTFQRPWFDQEFVKSKLNEHFDAKFNHRLLIWSLLSFEWLQRHFLDDPVFRKEMD